MILPRSYLIYEVQVFDVQLFTLDEFLDYVVDPGVRVLSGRRGWWRHRYVRGAIVDGDEAGTIDVDTERVMEIMFSDLIFGSS